MPQKTDVENGGTSQLSFVDRLEALIPELRAFARSLCRDATLADDLVQDTCLKAWSAIDSFKEDSPMRPWLFRILRNEFYQLKRRDWRNVDLDPEFAESALVDMSSPEQSADFARSQEIIYSLPPPQRDALILVLAAGMTYEEAGAICNCAAGTMKSRVSRARETVQSIMNGETTLGKGQKLAVIAAGTHWAALLRDIDAITSGDRAAA